MTDLRFPVDIWLRGDHNATTRHISGIDRDISSGTDRDSDICAGKCRGIVDSVTDHGYFALFPE